MSVMDGGSRYPLTEATEGEFQARMSQFFDGLRHLDPRYGSLASEAMAEIDHAAHTVDAFDLPFKPRLSDAANRLGRARNEVEEEDGSLLDPEQMRRAALFTGVKVYALSGVELQTVPVMMAVQYIGVSPGELREALRPRTAALYKLNVHSRDLKRMRERSYDAMRRLEVAPRLGLLMRYRDKH